MKRAHSISFRLAQLAVAASLPVGGAGALRAQEVVSQPAPSAAIQPYLSDLSQQSRLSRDQEIALLRQKVKYVFVIFQENRSFDAYFGTFPGARGLFARPPEETPGYTQPLINTDGTMGTIQPFRIGPQQFAADTDDVDHSFARMAAKINVQKGRPLMDRFALAEEMKWVADGQKPSLKAKQMGELDMAYEDCDTIPFLWNYASRFVLFDNFFQHTIGPSTPGAINLLAAQTGETQWVKHPETANNIPANAAKGLGEPVVSDKNPLWGSSGDHSGSGQPINPKDRPGGQLNQTYASLPLTLQGGAVKTAVNSDRDAATDLADVQQDIAAINARGGDAIPWGWYEEGYDHEPTDSSNAPAGGAHTSYIAHHNAPQYFGYIANNPAMSANLHGLGDFFESMQSKSLPEQGGLFYVRGGYQNIGGLKPADPDAAVQRHFAGDDDHPGYSDSQISEALVARTVNAVAASPYWNQSVILITYDESGGSYDHVPLRIHANGPDGISLGSGPRIPLVVISPYAKVHAVSHELGDQASIIKMADTLFNRPPLADLPDELEARVLGEKTLGQSNLGPADDLTPGIGGLLTAFDDDRLAGHAPVLPADYAEIPDNVVNTLPPYADKGCGAIGVVPVDIAQGINNSIPADFNPRPATNPSPAP